MRRGMSRWWVMGLGLWVVSGPVLAAGGGNLYSAREEELIKPLL